MTDYKNLKLIATSSPHIRAAENTRSIMLDVIIAMMPALIWAIVKFGFRALLLTAVSAAGCVFFEWGYRKIMKKPQSVNDLSAVVTGILLAFVCPVNMPYWMILVGDFFAIVVVKQLFGGIGKNFINPALAGRAALVASYAGTMSGAWADPQAGWVPVVGTADVVTAATPLAYMKSGDMAGLTSQYSVTDMFLGNIGGSLGEVCGLALIIGGIYLLVRKVISWHIPVAYLVTVAVFALLAGQNPLEHLLSGGLLLGAIFMATDYSTSPMTKPGKLIYGVILGLLTMAIRLWGSYPEGVSFAILLGNILTPHIDKLTRHTPLGVSKKKGGAKA